MSVYNQTVLSLFESFIKPVINASMTRDEVNQHVQEMLRFEMNLASLSSSRTDFNNIQSSMYHPTPLSQVNTYLSEIMDFNGTYLPILFPASKYGQIFGNDTKISLDSVPFFKNLRTLSEKTSRRGMQLYILIAHITHYIRSLGSIHQEKWNQVLNAMGVAANGIDRSERCVGITDDAIGQYSARFLVEKFEASKSKPIVESMIRDIKQAYITETNGSSWLDAETKRNLEDKLNGMSENVLYPSYIFNVTKLDRMHRYLNVSSTMDFLEMLLTIESNKVLRNRDRIVDRSDREEWEDSPQTVNAFYDSLKNAFVVTAAFMRAPYFSHLYPDYLNFAAGGSVIAHEMMHGFDADG